MKNTTTEKKFNRLDQVEKKSVNAKIGYLNYLVRETKRRNRMKKSEQSLWDIQDTIKRINIRVMGLSREGRGQKAYLNKEWLKTAQIPSEK